MLNTLCELIIDELKDFSANHRTISATSLFEALSGKEETLNALISQTHLSELKKGCIKILEDLYRYCGNYHKERTDELIEAIDGAQTLGQLYQGLDSIIGMIGECVADSHATKKSLAQLLMEVGIQLGEVESECLGLIESSAQAHLSDGRFATMIESEINALESSAQSSEDVLQVRQVLHTRLQTIKSALAAKKAEDLSRNQRVASTIQTLQNSLNEMQQKIDRDQKIRKHLEQEALIDPLTGISNRRLIERHIRREIKRYKREETAFSLIFIDVDDFKAVNDTHGHGVGDKCLQNLVERMQRILRATDFIGRFGGDEFIVLLPGVESRAAHVVADKLASAISKTCFTCKDSEIQLAVSIGLTQVHRGDSEPGEMIERADAALYEAKKRGRDCVIIA